MKRAGKIILIIVLVLLLALAGIVIWQRENIRAAITMLTTDSETIAEQAEQTRQEHQQTLEQEYEVYVQPPTAVQSEDLLMGKADPEQIKEELGLKEKAETSAASPSAGSSQKEILEKYVAKLYAKKVDLMAKLGEYRDEIYEKWKALPENERTDEKKSTLIFDGLAKCYDLEDATDAEVKQIVEECKAELKKAGADTSAADTLWDNYEKEKLTEKAYYMDKYMN